MCLNFLKLNKWTIVLLVLCALFIPLTTWGQVATIDVSTDSVKLSVTDSVYNKTAKTCSVAFVGITPVPTSDSYQITYNAVDSTNVTGKEIVATFKFVGDSYIFLNNVDSVTFSYIIIPAPVTVTWTSLNQVDYTGSSISPTILATYETTTTFPLDSYRVDYVYGDGDKTADTINVTDSSIIAKMVITDTNYSTTSPSSARYKITKKSATLQLSVPSKAYGDALLKADLRVTSIDIINAEKASFDFTYETTPNYNQGSDSGKYSVNIWPIKTNLPNYSFLDSTVFKDSLIITQKLIVADSVLFTLSADTVYNGTAKPVKVSLDTAINSLKFNENSDYTLTYAPDSVNAKTVTVTLHLLPSGNYTSHASIKTTYVITQALTKVVTPPLIDAGVSGQPLSSVIFKDRGSVVAVNGDLSQEPLAGVWTWKKPDYTLPLTGAPKKSAIFTPVNPNYKPVTHDFDIIVYNGEIYKDITDTIYVSSRSDKITAGELRFNGMAPELPFYSLRVAVDYVKMKPNMAIVVDKGDYYEDIKIVGHANIYGGYDFQHIKNPPVVGSTTIFGGKVSPLWIQPENKDSSVLITGLNLTRTAMCDSMIMINYPEGVIYNKVKIEMKDIHVTNSDSVKDPKRSVIEIYGKNTVVKNLLVANNETGSEVEVIAVGREATVINPTIAYNRGGVYALFVLDRGKVINALIQDNHCQAVVGLYSKDDTCLPLLKHATVVRNHNTDSLISGSDTLVGFSIGNCVFWNNDNHDLNIGTLTLENITEPNAIVMDTEGTPGLIRLGKGNKGDYGPRFVQPDPVKGVKFDWRVEPGSPLIQMVNP